MKPKSASIPSLKPPLKWAGGKRWLVSELSAAWEAHNHRRYVEPFCGGLAIALGLKPEHALLNDINEHLINFYRHLQQGLSIQIETGNNETLFYQHRQHFNELVRKGSSNGNGSAGAKSAEAAQLFYYLNRTCFNGLCRFNQVGEFNVPFGTYKSITYAEDFLVYKPLFREWQFTNQDIEHIKFDREDFIYSDPPYDVEFTTYSAGGFSWDDQVRTAELLADHPGPVVMSNQATKRVVALYKRLKFKIKYLEAPRRISRTGDRSPAREILATKNL